MIISIDRSPFEHIISVVHCARCLQWVFNRFGYGFVTYLCSFVKCREAPFGFQTVMQSGVSICFLFAIHYFWLRPLLAQFGFQSVLQSGDVKSCTHCFSVGFYFSLSQVLPRFASSSSQFRAEAPASRVRVAPGRVDPGADFAVPFALHLAEFSRAPKALWSPENSSKEEPEPKGKSMISARPVSCCRHWLALVIAI